MRLMMLISILGTGMIASSPAAAAPDFRDTVGSMTRHGAFVGAQARLSFGGAAPVVPVARLTAGTTNLRFDQSGAVLNRPLGTSFELGFSSDGRPNFYVGGQRISDLSVKLGIAPTGVALLAIGGAAVVGATVAGASGGSDAAESKKKNEAVCLGIGVCPPLGG